MGDRRGRKGDRRTMHGSQMGDRGGTTQQDLEKIGDLAREIKQKRRRKRGDPEKKKILSKCSNPGE